MSSNCFIVSLSIVSMVTGQNTKSAISQLLIKLETCGFLCLHLHFQLSMILHERKTWQKSGITHQPLLQIPTWCQVHTFATNSVPSGPSPCKPTQDSTKVCQTPSYLLIVSLLCGNQYYQMTGNLTHSGTTLTSTEANLTSD